MLLQAFEMRMGLRCVCPRLRAAMARPAEAVRLLMRTHLPPVYPYAGQEGYAQSVS